MSIWPYCFFRYRLIQFVAMKEKLYILSVAFYFVFGAIADKPSFRDVHEVGFGEVWKLDWSWRWVDVPLTSYVTPFITAWDENGRQVYSGRTGNIYKRAFDIHDLSVQKYRLYVRTAVLDGEETPWRCSDAPSIRLPASARKFRMSIEVRGDDAKYEVLSMSAKLLTSAEHEYLNRYRECEFPVMAEKPGEVLSDAELDRILDRREKCVPQLVSKGDRTELRINGRVVVPKIYKSSWFPSSNRLPAVASAKRMGFNIVTVKIPLGYYGEYPGIWRTDGSCDVEWVRNQLRDHLKRFPDGMFLLDITLQPHVGWAESNPGEVLCNENGHFGIYSGCRLKRYTDELKYNPQKEFPHFSYASEGFAKDAGKMLSQLFNSLESWPEGKAVIGSYICGGADTQWHDIFDVGGAGRSAANTPLADHSEAMKRGFAAFRRKKYGRNDVEVRIPSKEELIDSAHTFYDIHGSTLRSDYREYEGRAANRLRLSIARAIKSASDGRMLVGSYLPNGGAMGYATIANSFVQELYESRDWDFFAVVPHYRREYVDPSYYPVFSGTAVQRGKLVVGEMDLRSPDVVNFGYWGGDFWRSNHNEATFRRTAMQHAATTLVQGGGYHVYDMNGGWFATEAAQETWAAVNAMSEHAHDMPLPPESIALVGSERYFDFKAWNGRSEGAVTMMRELPRLALVRTGAPHAFYLVEDILKTKDAQLPKVVVFADTCAITYGQFCELKRRYANDGRVLVWIWRPGIFAKDGEMIEKELGIVPSSGLPKWPGFADGTCADPLMAGVSGTVMASFPSFGFHFTEICHADTSKGWKTLANLKQTDRPALSVRRHANYTEVYSSIQGGITPQLCRNFLREAGARPILDTDDISGYGSGLFFIRAQNDGIRNFRLPDGVKPVKKLEGPDFKVEKDGACSVFMKRAEMFILAVCRESK